MECALEQPVRFPSDAEVVLEEARRQRALGEAEQFRAYMEFLRSAERLMQSAEHPEYALRFAAEQEELARRNTLEFWKRHGV